MDALHSIVLELPALGLTASYNLGCLDIYPSTSGKEAAAGYLMQRWTAAPQHCAFMCDDDNDLKLASRVGRALVVSIGSVSARCADGPAWACQSDMPVLHVKARLCALPVCEMHSTTASRATRHSLMLASWRAGLRIHALGAVMPAASAPQHGRYRHIITWWRLRLCGAVLQESMAATVSQQPEHFIVARKQGVLATEESLDAAAAFFTSLK